MPNGKPGDHPINDILMHGIRRFGGGIDEEIEKVAKEFGEEGIRRLNAVVATPAFGDAEAHIREQQRILQDLLIDVWNELILERRRRSHREE
jgi:hypothetical protein